MILTLINRWKQHRYYYTRILSVLRFITSYKSKILYFGDLNLLICNFLEKFGQAFVVLKHVKQSIQIDSPKIQFFNSIDEVPQRCFDYIVCNSSLGESDDINRDLCAIFRLTDEKTRVIICQYNYLWESLLKIGALLNLKKKEKTQNWLSLSDLLTYLTSAGFKPIRLFRKTLCPVKLVFIGPLINFLATIIPIFDFFKIDQFIIAKNDLAKVKEKSLTICLTVKDEKDNIQSIVESLPTVNPTQEILFVEGHSTDGTREEIERMIRLYPFKNIRVVVQHGTGQGDAIRLGFREGKGDVIILYEGDGTSDPADIQYFYNAICNGRAEFIEGSRFVYPLTVDKMPFINQLGNALFAKWFSWLLGQKFTDVLGGIKAITKYGFLRIDETWGFLKTEDPFGDFELLYGAARYGLLIGEIPMKYKPRVHGRSKTRVFRHGLTLSKLSQRGFWIFRSSLQGENK